MEDSRSCVVCSTSHRAKGSEWNYVHPDTKFEAGFIHAARTKSRSAYEAEAVCFERPRIRTELLLTDAAVPIPAMTKSLRVLMFTP
jgi:hypothetical protein